MEIEVRPRDGTDPNRMVDEALWTLNHPPHLPELPPLWDGRAASRIAKILLEHHQREENGS